MKEFTCALAYIYPGRDGDTPVAGPVWQLGKELVDEKYTPTNDEYLKRPAFMKIAESCYHQYFLFPGSYESAPD